MRRDKHEVTMESMPIVAPCASADHYVHALLTTFGDAWRPLLAAAICQEGALAYDAAARTVCTAAGARVPLCNFVHRLMDCTLENEGIEFLWCVL